MINGYFNNKINKFIKINNKHNSSNNTSEQTNIEENAQLYDTKKRADKEKEAKIQKSLSMIDTEPEKIKEKHKSDKNHCMKKNEVGCMKDKIKQEHPDKSKAQEQECKPVLVLVSDSKEHHKSHCKSDSKEHHKSHCKSDSKEHHKSHCKSDSKEHHKSHCKSDSKERSKDKSTMPSKSDSEPHIKVSSKSDSKPHIKVSSKSDSKPHIKVSSKSDSKPHIKVSSKSDSKPHIKISSKSDSKPHIKISSKSDSKPHIKVSSKSDSKPHIKVSSKSDSRVKGEQIPIPVHKHNAKKNYHEYEQSECENYVSSDCHVRHNNKDDKYSICLNNAKKNKIVIKKIYNYYCSDHRESKKNIPSNDQNKVIVIPVHIPCPPCPEPRTNPCPYPYPYPCPYPCPCPCPCPCPEPKQCDCKTDICEVQYSNTYQITDYRTSTYIRFKEDTKVSFTMVGGGGAGGIGFCVKTLFFNGGGGAAGDTKKGVVDVKKNDVWKVTVGKGGSAKTVTQGQQSMIEFFTGQTKTQTITVNGGQNGYPYIQQVYAIIQGKTTCDQAMINEIIARLGPNIDPRNLLIDCKIIDITTPEGLNQLVLGGQPCSSNLDNTPTKCGQNGSVVTLCGKKGTPGDGGFTQHTGGGGKKGDVDNITGGSGSNGSGGGGGMCCDFDISQEQYSGDGGPGYVIIQFIPGIDAKNTNLECLMDVSKNSF